MEQLESIGPHRHKAKYELTILHGNDGKFRMAGYYMPTENQVRTGIWKQDTKILEFNTLEELLDWLRLNYK